MIEYQVSMHDRRTDRQNHTKRNRQTDVVVCNIDRNLQLLNIGFHLMTDAQTDRFTQRQTDSQTIFLASLRLQVVHHHRYVTYARNCSQSNSSNQNVALLYATQRFQPMKPESICNFILCDFSHNLTVVDQLSKLFYFI